MESLSSYNSPRFLDVKARPSGSSSSLPEADPARFPDPLADQQNAGRPEQAGDPSQRSDGDVGDGETKAGSGQSKRADRTSDKRASDELQEAENKPSLTDSREDESREVTISGDQAEVDPETVPTGSFGEEADGGETGEALPIAQPFATLAAPVAPVQTAPIDPVIPTGLPVGVEQVQAPVESTPVAAGLAAQVATPKTQTPAQVEGGNSADVNPLLAEEAPAFTAGFANSGQGQDFTQGEADAPLAEILTQAQSAAAPSIDAAIQDARIEAIAMDSRPVMQAQPIQVAAPSTIGLGAQTAASTEAILTQIQARIQPAMNRAILRLSPEALGRVAIEVTVDAGEVRAEMRVESADSLQAIQKYIPELKAMFAQADMELSELNLQLDSEGAGFDWEEESPEEQQTWLGKTAGQETNTDAPGGAKLSGISSTEGGLDLIA